MSEENVEMVRRAIENLSIADDFDAALTSRPPMLHVGTPLLSRMENRLPPRQGRVGKGRFGRVRSRLWTASQLALGFIPTGDTSKIVVPPKGLFARAKPVAAASPRLRVWTFGDDQALARASSHHETKAEALEAAGLSE